jgi:hypothetical protein
MADKQTSKPKLTDAERHKRFVEMAREVGASSDPKDFDKAFDEVIRPSRPSPGTKGGRGNLSKDE